MFDKFDIFRYDIGRICVVLSIETIPLPVSISNSSSPTCSVLTGCLWKMPQKTDFAVSFCTTRDVFDRVPDTITVTTNRTYSCNFSFRVLRKQCANEFDPTGVNSFEQRLILHKVARFQKKIFALWSSRLRAIVAWVLYVNCALWLLGRRSFRLDFVLDVVTIDTRTVAWPGLRKGGV